MCSLWRTSSTSPINSEEVRRIILSSCHRRSSWFGAPVGEIKPLTKMLVSRTTRGFSCILLLADSLNRFRHVTKNFLWINIFVGLLNFSCCFKEALFSNRLEALEVLRADEHSKGTAFFLDNHRLA